MLILKLKENNEYMAIYEFSPSGTDYVGVIGIDKKAKEIKLINTCAADWKYRAHAFKRMLNKIYIPQKIWLHGIKDLKQLFKVYFYITK